MHAVERGAVKTTEAPSVCDLLPQVESGRLRSAPTTCAKVTPSLQTHTVCVGCGTLKAPAADCTADLSVALCDPASRPTGPDVSMRQTCSRRKKSFLSFQENDALKPRLVWWISGRGSGAVILLQQLMAS